jgi:hypothetical protein
MVIAALAVATWPGPMWKRCPPLNAVKGSSAGQYRTSTGRPG